MYRTSCLADAVPKKLDWNRESQKSRVRANGSTPVTDELPRAGSPQEGSRADKLPQEVIPRIAYDERYGTGPVRPSTDATRAKLRARPETLRLKLQHCLSRISESGWAHKSRAQKEGQLATVQGTVNKLIRLDPSAAADPWVIRAQAFLKAAQAPE